jgi:hypothetical protein
MRSVKVKFCMLPHLVQQPDQVEDATLELEARIELCINLHRDFLLRRDRPALVDRLALSQHLVMMG